MELGRIRGRVTVGILTEVMPRAEFGAGMDSGWNWGAVGMDSRCHWAGAGMDSGWHWGAVGMDLGCHWARAGMDLGCS